MFHQERHPGEGLRAVLAAVLLHLRMSLEMRPEVGPVSKGAVTVLAGEGFLSSVSADVTLQQPRSGESLPTDLALTWQGVCADVHLQCSQGGVRLVAVLAAELFLGLQHAVELPVLGQATVGGVGLVTVCTAVFGGFPIMGVHVFELFFS